MMVTGEHITKDIQRGTALLREAEATSTQALYFIGYGHMEDIGIFRKQSYH